MLKKHKFLIIFISYTIIIWSLSSIPQQRLSKKYKVNDKVVHVIEFALLSALGTLAYDETWKKSPNSKNIIITFLACVSYGGVDELHQYFVLGRNSSLGDFIADAIGVIIGLGIVFICKFKKINKLKMKSNSSVKY